LIQPLRYGGQAKAKKNGQDVIVQVPGNIILNMFGAFLDVTITHPRVTQELFIKKGESIPSIRVKALIDTGAASSVISPKVADTVRLIHTGYRKIASVQDEQDRPVYFGYIVFAWGNGKEIPLVECPLKNFDCLIGRDILMHWYLTYNGPEGSIVICD
jgi:predicted aspartyl protease